MSDAHLLPPNATRQEIALSLAMARMASIPTRCREVWDPDACPAANLAWLAWAYSVDEWDSNWTDAQKRAVIKASYLVHRHKGTVGAMRAAVGAIGFQIALTEWFQETPPAEPGTFGLTAEVDGHTIQPGLWGEIEAVAIAAKNVRSHLRYVRLRTTARGTYYIGGTTFATETITVYPHFRSFIGDSGRSYIGCTVVTYETVTVYPRPAEYPMLLLQEDAATLGLQAAGTQLRLQS